MKTIQTKFLTCWCGEGVTPNPTYDLDPDFRWDGKPYAPWLHVPDPETGEAPADDEHEAIPTPESIQRSIT